MTRQQMLAALHAKEVPDSLGMLWRIDAATMQDLQSSVGEPTSSRRTSRRGATALRYRLDDGGMMTIFAHVAPDGRLSRAQAVV
jgi:hypothetical protein